MKENRELERSGPEGMNGFGSDVGFAARLNVSWKSWKAATRNPVEALRYEPQKRQAEAFDANRRKRRSPGVTVRVKRRLLTEAILRGGLEAIGMNSRMAHRQEYRD